MRFGSVCSGIEAASVAWVPLGWEAVFFSEIEAFPCAVLEHHHPDVPNLGDMTRFKEWKHYDIDVLVGGTPCQSFSVAGLRKGLDDPRGNLALTYLAIADKYRPRWLVWENVPGCLSSNGGRDFGTFLGGLAELGYGFAYRVLDAQYFGVPQRRRRVFVVGHSGDWRGAAAVLFEQHSLQGHPPPRREKGQDVAPTLRAGAQNGGAGHGARSGDSKDELITVAQTQDGSYVPEIVGQAMSCKWSKGSSGPAGDEHHNLVAYGIMGNIINRSDMNGGNGTGFSEDVSPTLTDADQHAVCVTRPIAFHGSQDPDVSGDITHPCGRNNGLETCVAFTLRGQGNSTHDAGRETYIDSPSAVRRLTPTECEALQGFPRDYTSIPWRKKPASECPDGPRYKALGNSMPVPVMRWIGERIQAVFDI